MNQGDILGVGILLVALGGAFWFISRLLVRFGPRKQQPAVAQPDQTQTDQHQAVIIIQPGGSVLHINASARKLFRLEEKETPNLEHLARRIRPAEKFLELCAQEGEASLVIDGQSVETMSFQVSLPNDSVMAVSIRNPGATGAPGQDQSNSAPQSFIWLTEFTQVVGTSLDLEVTLHALQESLDRMLPADFVEVSLWQPEEDSLLPYRFVGPSSGERHIEEIEERYQPGKGFAGEIARNQRPQMVGDLIRQPDLQPSGGKGVEALQSLIGVPLIARDEMVGTLVVGSVTRDAFSAEDLNLLNMISGPTATALANARRFQLEQRRSAELASLAQLAQSFSSALDPTSLFPRLVHSIVSLVKVEILGFLIYNENTRTLEGQDPIYGLPSQFVELYRVPVPPNSPAETMLLNQDLIITESAADSPEWETLGLSYLARAASLRDTVLVPLNSGGRMLGYLQASNHADGSQQFSQEEIHLLTIISNQAAPVIENVALVIQARQRVLRAETLRRISSLASSSATFDEILKYSLQDLSRLLHADLSFIFLQDQNQGVLQLHRPSLFGQPEAYPDLSLSLPVDDPQFHFTITGRLHAFITRNINDEKAVIPFYQQLAQTWQVVSMVAVPLIVRDAGIGEIWLCNRQDGAFDQGDVQVVATAAGQLAGVVEQSYLSAQTDEYLRQRIGQLMALTRVTRELSVSRDLSNLLRIVYDESLKISGATCGTILLIDFESGEENQPTIRYHHGDVPPDPLSPEMLRALSSGETVLIDGMTETHISLPHDHVESILVVPIRYQTRPVGLILLHGTDPEGFESSVVNVILSLAAQASIALGDAYLYGEQQYQEFILQRKLRLMDRLFNLSQAIRSNRSLPEILEEVANGIRESTPFQVVLVSVYDSHQAALRRTVGVGLGSEVWEELKTHLQPWESLKSLFQPEFQVGSVFYIPTDRSPIIPKEVHTVTVLPENKEDSKSKPIGWDPDDLLFVPLFSAKDQPIGLISLDAPSDGAKPDKTTFEALEMLSAQACLAIETWQKIAERDMRVTNLEDEQSRLRQAADQARLQIPLFLRHDLQQTLAIDTLNRRMERVRAGLDIAEQSNRQPDVVAILKSLARELLTRFDMQVALVAESRNGNIRLLDVLGSSPTNTNPESLFGQRNPLRQLLQDGQLQLVANVEDNAEWRNTALLAALQARSFIAMPLEIDQERRGGILVIGRRTLAQFTQEDYQIYNQLSRQVSLGAQNLNLLVETRRRLREMDLLLEFTRKLGLLDPRGILLTLVETVLEVLPNADAGWVARWVDNKTLVPEVARGYSDNRSMLSINFQSSEGNPADLLPIRAIHSGQPLRTEVVFAKDYSLQPEDLMRYRQATGGRLPVSALIVPIGRSDRIIGVLVVDQFSLSDAFEQEDEALAVTLAQQSALALDNSNLFVSAEQRAHQLQSLNQVSSAISSSLQQGELISSLLPQLRLVLPYETATLWLKQENTLAVASAAGFTDNESRLGISVAVEDSALFQEMVQTSQPLSIADVRQDARFPSVLEPDHLSWLGIPMLVKAELIGVIALEKHEPGFYNSEHMQTASTFASQAGVAIENARLFEESTRRAAELDQRSQRLVLLNTLSGELSSSLDEEAILHLTCNQLLKALNVRWVSAVLIDDADALVVKADVPEDEVKTPVSLPETPLLIRLRESHGIFSTLDVRSENELKPVSDELFVPRGAQSVLFVPLITAVNLHGWMVIQTDSLYRFSSSEIELARTISNQAAVALQNARLYNQTRLLTQDLERRVEARTREVRREHNNTQALLRIITELSSSLDMDLVMQRTLSVLNESIGAEQSLILLNDGKSYVAGVELALSTTMSAPLKGAHVREISTWVTRRRAPALVDDITADPRWEFDPAIPASFHSVIGVPLVLGEETLGSLLLLHQKTSAFMLEQVSLVEATARQFSIALNNAELFKLIRDQSEHMGSLLHEQQVESSRSRAILESVADGVLVTDSAMKVTLFNPSAERILNLKSGDVLGKPLESLIGLFGKPGQIWHETIRRWSQEPQTYQAGETFAEQINLDQQRVVAVNLAPVFFRDQFLATVSIFRDITQEVKVDKLKTEFVANVSHELRTPMTSILGYIDIILMGAAGEVTTQQQHFLDIVKSNTVRLNVLVNDLLDVSRIEAGRVELSMRQLDLRELAGEVIADFQHRSRQDNKSIHFILDAPGNQLTVMGDTLRIKQVITNLVSNSYNYTPENGQVVVRVHAENGEVQIDVEDNGIGVNVEQRERIFERFYRGEDPLVLSTAGTGLGLAISKILVEMHRGRIWFRSSGVRGEGSIFSFALPVVKGEE